MTDLVKTFAEGFPAGQAVRLEEMIAYGDNAVVSRTLAKSDSGTLTLFAFDAGQELSEHTAPFDAFVQILDGKAVLTIGGEVVPAEAGQNVLMPAGVPHALSAEIPMKMVLFMLRK